MGGNIFTNAQRIPHDDYLDAMAYFHKRFCEIGRSSLVPKSLKDKIDHGDLDIIVKGDVLSDHSIRCIFGLQPEEISRNSSVVSILYREKYQVDLCFHPEEDFLTAYQYNCHSDCGNLMGRLYHAIGMKLGHRGLMYPLRVEGLQSSQDFILSKTFVSIVDFLGLDSDKWISGFENREDLFRWITSSPYFNKQQFMFDNLNHINRIRNRKRETFAAFVEWLKPQEFANNFEPCKNKAEYLWSAVTEFQSFHVLQDINKTLVLFSKHKEANKKFNGYLVQEWTGLTGPDLGRAMAQFRETLGVKDATAWRNWRLSRSEKEIKRNFLLFAESSGMLEQV